MLQPSPSGSFSTKHSHSLERIQDRATSYQIHSAVNDTIFSYTLSCADYIRETIFHLYSMQCSSSGGEKIFPLKRMLNQILATTVLLPGILLRFTIVSRSLPPPSTYRRKTPGETEHGPFGLFGSMKSKVKVTCITSEQKDLLLLHHYYWDAAVRHESHYFPQPGRVRCRPSRSKGLEGWTTTWQVTWALRECGMMRKCCIVCHRSWI